MKLVFFCSSKFVIPIIEVLQKNFDLNLIITTERESTNPVISYCKKSKVCCYVATDFRKNEVLQKIQKANANIAVLAYFGLILPDKVLNVFSKGIINIHPSLLPKYRGPSPGQTAILNGDKQTGVTIIKLDKEVDHGPILVQETEPILPDDTAETLYERLFTKGARLLTDCIQKYLEGKLQLTDQNHTKTIYTQHLTRQDGFINLQSPPSPQFLNRMIRAYHPWPGVWTELRIRNQELRIKFLPKKIIQVEGKKPMSYKDFLNGYPEAKELILALRL